MIHYIPLSLLILFGFNFDWNKFVGNIDWYKYAFARYYSIFHTVAQHF